MSQDEPLHSGSPFFIPVSNADGTDPVKNLIIDNPFLKGFLDPTSTEPLTPAEQKFAEFLVPQRYKGSCENAGTAWGRRRAIYYKLRDHPLAEQHRKVSWPFWPWPQPPLSATAASRSPDPFTTGSTSDFPVNGKIRISEGYLDEPIPHGSLILPPPLIQSDAQQPQTDLHADQAEIPRRRRHSDLIRSETDKLIQEYETKQKLLNPVIDGKMVVLANQSSDTELLPISVIVDAPDALKQATKEGWRLMDLYDNLKPKKSSPTPATIARSRIPKHRYESP